MCVIGACRQLRAWSDSGIAIVPVAVNVSGSEFLAKDFLSGVRAALIATGIEPQNLELELTESVLMQDAEPAVVTNIGKSLNQRVIAEGVDFLRSHECDEGQGYYFSHPVVAEQAGSLLETGLKQELVQVFDPS
jgi:EAL domain-containing protein (putative c-di-GMP-specific phosphodiesterase class I)